MPDMRLGGRLVVAGPVPVMMKGGGRLAWAVPGPPTRPGSWYGTWLDSLVLPRSLWFLWDLLVSGGLRLCWLGLAGTDCLLMFLCLLV